MKKRKTASNSKNTSPDYSSSTRVKTGVFGFDELISGGFKKFTVNLVTGGPGSGKTIFAMQYLVNGIEKYNENALYITFEEKKEKLYGDVRSFGWDLEKYEKEKKFIFLEYTPEQVKRLLVEGGGIVENIVERYKVQRLVIDSITSFTLLYQDELAKKEASLALFELISNWKCTAVITSQESGQDLEYISDAMGFEADSIIILYYIKRHGSERKRALEILKMRGTRHSGRVWFIDINPNKGITVEKRIADL